MKVLEKSVVKFRHKFYLTSDGSRCITKTVKGVVEWVYGVNKSYAVSTEFKHKGQILKYLTVVPLREIEKVLS